MGADPKDVHKYKVGFLPRPQIVTEIRRPDPAACLVLQSNSVVELSNEEIRILLHQESGPLIARDLLTLVVADAPAGSGKQADHGGGEGGQKPEGAQGQAGLDGSGSEDGRPAEGASKKAGKAAK